MTVGEKIQYYRKMIGLSQEELGQKMLVSRQSVCLWEMDKTLPTIDNLLRLKELFAVSVDEILSEAEPTEETVKKPKEAYIFKYEKKDLQEIFKRVRLPLITRAAAFTLAGALLFVIVLAIGAHPMLVGLPLGALFLGLVSHIKGILAYTQAWKKSESNILENRYSYELFDTHLTLRIFKGEECSKMLKIQLDNVKKTLSFGNYLLLQIARQLYIIKKDALPPDSAFLALCASAPSKEKANRQKQGGNS